MFEIGVDIGGTNIKYGLVNEALEIVAHGSIPFPKTTAEDMGGPGYCIKGEFSHNGFQNDLAHTEGVLSMARAMNPNSAGSQFFIMHKDAPYLNGEYAAFGQVIDGMDIVNKIAEVRTDYSDRPMKEQKIKSITAETFGVEYPEPEKC